MMKRKNEWLSMISVLALLVLVSGVSADSLVFQDNFNGGLATNWTTGTNTAINTAPTVHVTAGRVVWEQGWDYIESKSTFGGNFRVEVDLERIQGSVACKDFVIEFVNDRTNTGVLRLQYGTIAKDTINMGAGPSLDSASAGFEGVCVEDNTGYRAEMDTAVPHTGTASLTYNNGTITFAFKNAAGHSIQTPAATVGTLADTRIRIWATTDSRFVDEVRVYDVDGQSGDDCAWVDLSNADIVIPCLMIDGVQYRATFNYDPAIPNGFYWKLDPTSVAIVD